MVSLGIDIGGTSVKTAILRGGTVVGTGASAPYARPDVPHITAAITDALRKVFAAMPKFVANSADSARSTPSMISAITAIGLCAPGLIDRATTQVTLSANLPALIGKRLDQITHAAISAAIEAPGPSASASNPAPMCDVAKCDLPLSIVPDALAAATDFASTRTPALTGRLLALSLGTGVGACILDGDKQLLVNDGTSGHLGQIDVSLESDPGAIPIGPDSGRGSLEAYIGVPALRYRFGEQLQTWLASPTLDDPPIRALIRALRIAHAIYRPHHIALLGGIGVAIGGSPIASSLRPAIADGLTNLARPDWTLTFAKSHHHAAAGAARLALGLTRSA